MANRPSSKRGPIPDIRLMVSFFDHPKIKRLHKELGAEGVLSLIRLWLWAAINRPLGELENMTAEDIGVVAQWPDSAKFLRTLKKIGLIEKSPEKSHYKIHNWEKHQPWVFNGPVRSEIGKIAAQAKWDKRRNEIAHANNGNEQCSNGEQAMPNDKNSNAPIHSSSSQPIGHNSSSSLPATSRKEQDLSATHSSQENQEEDKGSDKANGVNVRQFVEESMQNFIANQDNPNRFWPKLNEALRGTISKADFPELNVLQLKFRPIVDQLRPKILEFNSAHISLQNIDEIMSLVWPLIFREVRSNHYGFRKKPEYMSLEGWAKWVDIEMPRFLDAALHGRNYVDSPISGPGLNLGPKGL